MALAHIFLHVGLCSAIQRASPETTIAMHAQMSYRVGGSELDKIFKFQRGDGTETVVEFDVPRAVYRLQLDVPKYHCGRSDYLSILADQSRSVGETLTDAKATPPSPVVLMDGTAPMSFLYVKPTFVLFQKSSVACNQAVTEPVPAHIDVEYDQGAYYVWLHSDSRIETAGPLVLALRLKTPGGAAHYVRVPVAFPIPWRGWPESIQFDVTEDMVDSLATEKTATLLCPKLWGTSAG